MRSQLLLLTLAVLLPISASAGGIYGTIKADGALSKRVKSVYVLHDSHVDTGKVDTLGNYSMYIRFEGKCHLFLEVDTLKSDTVDVNLYKRSVRYNWIIEEKKNQENRVIGYKLRRE